MTLVVPVRECDAGCPSVGMERDDGVRSRALLARAGRAMRLRMGMRWDNTSYPNAPKLNTAKGLYEIFEIVVVGGQKPFRESPKIIFGQADRKKNIFLYCFPNSI